jgi:hypothetical protein
MFDDILGGKEAKDCSVVTDRNYKKKCVGVCMYGCFGYICTCICCVLYCLYCVFCIVPFMYIMYIYSYLFCLY